MRAKKLTTVEEDGVLMVLKGGKHVTSSVAAGPQLKASAETSFHNWSRPNCRIRGSADSLNNENGSHALGDGRSKSHQKEGKVLCGNSSFLSRFIEFRINDSKLCVKVAPGTENGNEGPGSTEESEIPVLAHSACNKTHVDTKSSSRGADALDTQIVSPYQLDENATKIPDTLSRPGDEKEGKDVKVEEKKSSSEQFDVNPDTDRVIGGLQRTVLSDISAVRTVEDLRTRIEGQAQNATSGKEICKNGNSGVKTYRDESPVTKSASEAKQDGGKVDSRRTGASTKDSPPRKASFRLRGSSSNGRLSSSHVSSAAARRSSNLNKALLTDARVPNLSSSKVAALASKFNAIIHENEGERSGEIIQNNTKKKLLTSHLTTGFTANTTKKPPSAEKLFVSRRSSSNSKRESSLSNPGCNANIASLGTALKKHSSVKRPLVETESSHKSYCNGITKDCKRRNNMAYRPSAAGTKSGSVKAAIQIFEKNAAVFPSTKSSVGDSEQKRKVAVKNSSGESKQPPESAEAKREPKYHRVIFKQDSTLVRVNLDCEDVCNEGKNSEQGDGNVNTHCQRATPRLLPSTCGEESEKVCVKSNKDLKSYRVQGRSNQDVTVKDGSGQNKTELNKTKTKPVVPLKNVTKEQIQTSVPFSKNNTNDSNYVQVMCKGACKLGSVCGTTGNAGTAEKALVRQDKLVGPQNSTAVSESSMKKPHTTQETKNSQQGDKESVIPNKSFLWGASVPGANQSTSAPGTNQSTSAPGTNQSTTAPGTNQSTSVPGTNQPTLVPGTNQPMSVPATNQSTSVSVTNQSTSVPGANQLTSVPALVTKDYESPKPDNCANVTSDSTDDVYDDVYPPSAVCSTGTSSNHPYAVVQPQDDDVYDDVGPPITEERQRARSPAFVVSTR
jgi:hypothetical protein